MRKVTLLSVLVGFGCAQTQTAFVLGPPSSALDGNTFEVVLDDGETKRDERLTFDIGQFSCSGCSDDNFSPAPYSIERTGETVRFKSQARSVTDGLNNWAGTVHDGRAAGRV